MKENQKSVVDWAGQAPSPDFLLVDLSRAYARLVASYCSGESVDEGAAEMQIILWRLADALGFSLADETAFLMFIKRQGR